MRLEETRLPGGMFRLAPPDVEKPRHLTPGEKVAYDRQIGLLRDKADSRSTGCWSYGCHRRADVWVLRVGFDFKGERADIERHAAITSDDYPGPVPGFCHLHLGDGPRQLAEAVYFDRPETHWGARPNRWFVSFTDGTRQGGDIMEIDPKQEAPTLTEALL